MRAALVVLLALIVAACTVPNWLSPYRIEVQQGNFVTQDMVARLKPGMTRSQVRFALGTPLLTDVFHQDRWDYVFVLNKDGRVAEKRTVTVVFVDDKLYRVEGDVVAAMGTAAAGPEPSGAAPAPSPAAPAASAPPPPPAEPAQPE